MLYAFSGCSGASDAAETTAGTCHWQKGEPSVSDAVFDEHREDRLACAFGPGASTIETIGGGAPDAAALKHVIVVMLENRSFDHMLGALPSSAGAADREMRPNPDGMGGIAPRYHETHLCAGDGEHPAHEWSDAHLALAAGEMNGFAQAGGLGAMGYFDECDLPMTYYLASTFALSDRYFAPLLGPTQPNRMFFFAGTSCDYAEGIDSNVDVALKCGTQRKTILKHVEDAGRTYGVYDADFLIAPVLTLTGQYVGAAKSIRDFGDDVMNDRLPDLSIVGASTGGEPSPPSDPENDDHPPADVRSGDAFLLEVMNALTSNQAVWSTSALFITFDESGGFYDHVLPPCACDPEHPHDCRKADGADAGTPTTDYAFDQYGFRVPLILVSPFARPGYVSHVDADHTSITRFIEHWLHLGALTARDANAWPLLDLFDFGNPHYEAPQLPKIREITACVPWNPRCAN
jgi:phospholipase C